MSASPNRANNLDDGTTLTSPDNSTSMVAVKVGALQHVRKVDVPLRLVLLQHSHRVRLAEEGVGGAQYSHLNQLQHHLLDQLLVGYFE